MFAQSWKRASCRSWISLAAAAWCLTSAVTMAADSAPGKPAESPFRQRIAVPDFPEDLTWVNTSRPIELRDLRGKLVLLDFWTYGCINCMHILPELKKAEEAYPRELVVIGVHSAKFENEQDAKKLSGAVARYGISHPVVSDPRHTFWERFGVHVWPTLLLIDPEGYLIWGTRGEITFDKLAPTLKTAASYYRAKKLLDDRPVDFGRATIAAEATPLRFPGKILADETQQRLFIADSGHHRLVIAKLDGSLIAVIGSGQQGSADGDYATASFNHPQGMALHGETLYVADTENHLLRAVDLKAGRVAAVAGIGRQGREPIPPGRMSKPLQTPLNSPWDVYVHGTWLYIAMAGPHQIWRMALDGTSIGLFAGNGREDIVDGPALPSKSYEPGFASFAQPSGLASDGQWLYVADSEGSSIRAIALEGGRKVRTVVGTAHLPQARLFTFGDADGGPTVARFQHPLGVAFQRAALYVADTYNDKIKAIDLSTRSVRTIAATAQEGNGRESRRFNEPSGLSATAGKLYVADTNNHRLCVIDLGEGNKASTLMIPSLAPPKNGAKKRPAGKK